MKGLVKYYNRLNLLALAVFVVLVFLQSVWLRNATLLQQQENEWQLKQLVSDIALEVSSLKQDSSDGKKWALKNISIDAATEKIQEVLKKNDIEIPTYFSIFQETDKTNFIGNKAEYKAELLQSEIKSCFSCIISFSMARQEDGIQKPGESDEDFMERLHKASTFQYFAPVQNLLKKEQIWLTLYQPFSFSYALQSMMALFITNIILLLILIFLFTHLLKLLSNYRKISELKEEFFNNMTHEFKTPLSSIRLASRVLRKNTDPEKAVIYYDLIERESKTLEIQIDKLLELSLLDNQEIKLEKTSMNVHELIREIPKRLQPLLEKKQADIQFDLQLSNPNMKLDQHHFSNSLCNLVENSLKYSEESVKIWISTFDKNGTKNIIVRDNGLGIKSEFQPHIFERFYRAKKSNQYKTKGFGIGLSYVKSIVEAHNGTIRLNSEYKNGCEFLIKLSS